MHQSDVDRAVAKATKESLAVVRQRGFSLTNPFEPVFDLESIDLPPQIDWEIEQQRYRTSF